MFKYVMNSFWLDFQQSPQIMCYIIGVAICDIIMFAIMLFYNPAIGLAVCSIAAFSAVCALKMYGDGMDESHHDLYITYRMLSEILSGAIFIHVAWWLFNIPLTIIEYRKHLEQE